MHYPASGHNEIDIVSNKTQDGCGIETVERAQSVPNKLDNSSLNYRFCCFNTKFWIIIICGYLSYCYLFCHLNQSDHSHLISDITKAFFSTQCIPFVAFSVNISPYMDIR